MTIILLAIVSIILIALIMLQERASGLSSVLGGGENTPYHTRRGLEKIIFRATIGFTVLFGVLAIIALIA